MQNAEFQPTLILNEHCQHCPFQKRCHTQAIEEDNLSLLRGMPRTEIMRLKRRGIFTVHQLSYTFRPRRPKKRAKNPAHPHYFALQARAIRENKVFVHGSLELAIQKTRVYMDFEGTPDNQSYYLVGLVVCQEHATTEMSFWSDCDKDEIENFITMLNWLKQYAQFSFVHYGSYEIRALKRMKNRLPAEYASQIDCIIKQSINMLSPIFLHIYFPTFSNSLKDIAGYLGYKWSLPNASGAHSLALRYKWLKARDDNIKNDLIRYNIEDCLALKIVTELVGAILHHNVSSSNYNVDITHIDMLEVGVEQCGKSQKQEFMIDEFDFINRCSYFDYQKDKLSARKKGQKSIKHPTSSARRIFRYRNNKVVKLFLSRCPTCRSKKLISKRPLKRQVIDLKFSGVAVRRWVVLYVSHEYRCRRCSGVFVPDGFPKTRTRFGSGLLSWCMYQILVGGQNMLRVQSGLERLFRVRLDISTLYRFKGSIADFYETQRYRILDSLMESPVLYVDETSANLRSEAGYVWCITDGSSAFYCYRGSREGSFLPEMFRNFKGVLVSDFYTAYDMLECRQQRCLVHLMRDFNEEMQRYPFDAELRSLATRFSVVLRNAVATIDKHGYKAHYLRKHRRPAADFCDWASNCEFSSRPAERLRSRIERYKDKLFTFLEYDGVSWNNTSAEHFIKPFARHRERVNGNFTERSIHDYLVILTVAQTCTGQGKDFLDFLLGDSKADISWKPRKRRAGASTDSFGVGGLVRLAAGEHREEPGR
jgi:hypothetical protein